MANAYLTNVDRNASAKVFAAYSNTQEGIAGVAPIPFDTAEEAFADAVTKQNSGRYALVRAWVEGTGLVDFPQIEEILEYWQKNP